MYFIIKKEAKQIDLPTEYLDKPLFFPDKVLTL